MLIDGHRRTQHGACLPLARGRWATQMQWTEVMALQQISERWERLRSPRRAVGARCTHKTNKQVRLTTSRALRTSV
jgi:hypothetical protein